MKTAIILAATIFVQSAIAAIVPPTQQAFTLTASPDASVKSYAIYIGTNSGSYSTRIVTTNLTVLIDKTNMVAGITNFLVATAIDTNGIESLPCPEINYVPPRPPGLKLSTAILESSSIDGPWNEMTNLPTIEIAISNPQRYYRSRVLITQ